MITGNTPAGEAIKNIDARLERIERMMESICNEHGYIIPPKIDPADIILSQSLTKYILDRAKTKVIVDQDGEERTFIWWYGNCYELNATSQKDDIIYALDPNETIYEQNVYGARITEYKGYKRFSLMRVRSDG